MLEELAAAQDCAHYLAQQPTSTKVCSELVDLGDRLVMRTNLPH